MTRQGEKLTVSLDLTCHQAVTSTAITQGVHRGRAGAGGGARVVSRIPESPGRP